jgi:Ras-related protein Rab-5C
LVSEAKAPAAAAVTTEEGDEAQAGENAEETEESEAEATSPTSPTSASGEDEDPRQVSREEAEAYAKEANLLFFEASAKVCLNTPRPLGHTR